jgi:predicted nucleic-acid-binding Zn-ribbon protein
MKCSNKNYSLSKVNARLQLLSKLLAVSKSHCAHTLDEA